MEFALSWKHSETRRADERRGEEEPKKEERRILIKVINKTSNNIPGIPGILVPGMVPGYHTYCGIQVLI
jgi:hypothetical protein